VVSTLKLTKIQIPNSDSDVISLDASTGNITLNKNLGGTSITVQGENTATTNLQQGLAKVWCNHSHDGSIQDSFNVSSVTDQATASHDINFTNSISNSVYSAGCGAFGTSQKTFGVIRTSATSSYRCNTYNDAGSADERDTASLAHGDLA